MSDMDVCSVCGDVFWHRHGCSQLALDAHLAGRREMFAEVMRVVDEFEDSDASKYLEGAWLSLWQRTVDAIIDNIRAIDPDNKP